MDKISSLAKLHICRYLNVQDLLHFYEAFISPNGLIEDADIRFYIDSCLDYSRLSSDDLYKLYLKLKNERLVEYLEQMSAEKWHQIFLNVRVSMEFINTFKHKLGLYVNSPDYTCWSCISEFQDLSEQFIEENESKLDWSGMCRFNRKFSVEFILKYKSKIYDAKIARSMCMYQHLPEEILHEIASFHVDPWFIIEYKHVIPEYILDIILLKCDMISERVSRLHYLSEEFIDRHAGRLVWYWILCKYSLSEYVLDKHSATFTDTDWLLISCNQVLSENFISRHANSLVWTFKRTMFYRMSRMYTFESNHQFLECRDYINKEIRGIAGSQKLSEEFIERYADRVNWEEVFIYQEISYKFESKHESRVCFDAMSKEYNLNLTTLKRYEERLNWDIISRFHRDVSMLIKEFPSRINWNKLSGNKHVSSDIYNLYNDQLNVQIIVSNIRSPFFQNDKSKLIISRYDELKRLDNSIENINNLCDLIFFIYCKSKKDTRYYQLNYFTGYQGMDFGLQYNIEILKNGVKASKIANHHRYRGELSSNQIDKVPASIRNDFIGYVYDESGKVFKMLSIDKIEVKFTARY